MVHSSIRLNLRLGTGGLAKRRQLTRAMSAIAFVLWLAGCASNSTLKTAPSWPAFMDSGVPTRSRASHPCKTRQGSLELKYATPANGQTVWTVLFDAATRRDLASQRAADEEGVEQVVVNELSCVLDEVLRGICPTGWQFDERVAVDLEDGRLLASGLCKNSAR